MALVTQVKLFLVRDQSGALKARGSCLIAHTFVLSGLRVIAGSNGPWVAMPARKTPSGKFEDIFYPVNKEGKREINDAVLLAYEAAVADAAKT